MDGSEASLDERQLSAEEDDMEKHGHGSRHNTQTSIKSSASTGKTSKAKGKTKKKEANERKQLEDTIDKREEDAAGNKEEEEQEGRWEDDAGDAGKAEDASGTQKDDEDATGQEKEGAEDTEGRDQEGDEDAGGARTPVDEEADDTWQQDQPRELEPQEFNGQDFLNSIDELSEKLHADNLRNIDEDFPAEELSRMVNSVTTTLGNFQAYSRHSQAQMEGVRDQLKDIKDRMIRKIQSRPYDSKSGDQRMTLEERELEAKIQQLNRELARANEDLARATVTTTETEEAAVQATLVAEQAAENARQIQAEYEARRQADMESRRAEEERRQAEEERKQEEERRMEETRKAEEMRRSRLVKPGDQEAKAAPDWEKWPVFKYRLSRANDFDQGIGCIVRGPNNYREDQLSCTLLDQLSTTFSCVDNEELVGNIVRIEPSSSGEKLKSPIIVVMPHCTSRASAMTREPVIKAEVEDGRWVELPSFEISMEGYKDIKFVQADVSKYSNLAVVSRFKRDFLHMSKRGGRVVSNSDSRVTFTAERGTFKGKENFVLQLQPVDSGTMKEVTLKRTECKGLLTSSSIVSMEWASKEFGLPITMTLPCPPNPVKARKAAAVRAAKEAKRKNPAPPPVMMDDDERMERRRKKKEVRIASENDENAPKPTKWYMGQYGANDEDENDLLFFIRKGKNGRWSVMEHMPIVQIKLDIVQLSLREPIDRFMVLRTRTSIEAKDAQQMAEVIEHHLSQRTVNVIVKQRSVDQSDVIMHVTPVNKSNRLLRLLEEDGYDDGPGASSDVHLKEGDMLSLCFRGNIRGAEEDDVILEVPFNSNMKTSLSLSIGVVDRYLQKSYNVYRGFVQIKKKVKTARRPTKEETEDGVTGMVTEVNEELVCEQLVNIPKMDQEQEMDMQAPTTRKRAPVVLKNTMDPVNQDTLHHLAVEMKDEWQMVAHHLNIKRMRIQAILVDHHYNENPDEGVKYDMLMTWAKRVPRGMNKVEILKNALVMSGRSDLAKELLELNEGFQRRREVGEQDMGGPQEIEAH